MEKKVNKNKLILNISLTSISTVAAVGGLTTIATSIVSKTNELHNSEKKESLNQQDLKMASVKNKLTNVVSINGESFSNNISKYVEENAPGGTSIYDLVDVLNKLSSEELYNQFHESFSIDDIGEWNTKMGDWFFDANENYNKFDENEIVDEKVFTLTITINLIGRYVFEENSNTTELEVIVKQQINDGDSLSNSEITGANHQFITSNFGMGIILSTTILLSIAAVITLLVLKQRAKK